MFLRNWPKSTNFDPEWDIFWSWDYGFGAWQTWIFGDFLKNCRLHQAVTFCLFGVRSQPRYLKVSTPRAWSIARVKSRVARFYARFFLWWSERYFRNFSSGDVHHPTSYIYAYMKSNTPTTQHRLSTLTSSKYFFGLLNYIRWTG